MKTDQELTDHIAFICKEFKGQLPELSQAIGALYLGKHFGWRVLRITISSKTYARHQRHLQLDFKEEMLPEGELAYKSVGLKIVNTAQKFWEAVEGHFKMDSKERTELI